MLTGNDLGKLGNTETLPGEDEIRLFLKEDLKAEEVVFSGETDEIHLLAKYYLENQDIEKAWKLLLAKKYYNGSTRKIKMIGETQTFGSNGFRKREVVVTTEEQYPQHIMVEFVQDKTDLLNNFQVGQPVKIGVNLRGREWVNQEKQNTLTLFRDGELKTFRQVVPADKMYRHRQINLSRHRILMMKIMMTFLLRDDKCQR